jgi:hypothetical protein
MTCERASIMHGSAQEVLYKENLRHYWPFAELEDAKAALLWLSTSRMWNVSLLMIALSAHPVVEHLDGLISTLAGLQWTSTQHVS